LLNSLVDVQFSSQVTASEGGTTTATLVTRNAEASKQASSQPAASSSGSLPLYIGIAVGASLAGLAVILLAFVLSRRQGRCCAGSGGGKARDGPTSTHLRTLRAREARPPDHQKLPTVHDREAPEPVETKKPAKPQRLGTRLDMTGFSMLLQHGILPDTVPAQAPALDRQDSQDSLAAELQVTVIDNEYQPTPDGNGGEARKQSPPTKKKPPPHLAHLAADDAVTDSGLGAGDADERAPDDYIDTTSEQPAGTDDETEPVTFWIDDETGDRVNLPANIREIIQDMDATESEDEEEDNVADSYIQVGALCVSNMLTFSLLPGRQRR
jgi:hypothetical protein